VSIAILVDFDGTIAKKDASYAILDKYAVGDWYSIEEKAYAHEITILEALKLQAEMVRVSREEAERFLKENIRMREGFVEFSDWCRENGIHLEICSDGFDFTIEILLKHWDIDWIPYTSNRTLPSEEGTTIEFPYHRDDCPINANCKCSHLERLKEKHDTVIFIGDGTTDECVSGKADILFARDKLLEICKRTGTPYIPWEKWSEVLKEIRCVHE
jgi:2,3-diketo-5-methylthio-1-phosphopentane phosphatase